MATIYGDNTADRITGTGYDDLIFGWDEANAPGDRGPATDRDSLLGNAGNDTIKGGAGNDTLDGSAGNDRLGAGEGDDLLIASTGNDTLIGDLGNDTLGLIWGQGVQVLEGGEGTDILRLETARDVPGPVRLTLGDPSALLVLANGTTVTGFEQLMFLGGLGDDRVSGGALGDSFYGDDGNDTLKGWDGTTISAVAPATICSPGAAAMISSAPMRAIPPCSAMTATTRC